MGKGFQGPCLSGFLTPKSLRLGLKEGHGGWLGEQRALGEQAAVRAEGEGEIGPGLGPALPYHHVPWAFEEYENSFLSSFFF